MFGIRSLARAIVGLSLVLGVAPTAGADVPVDVELVLAVDVSGSVDPTEAWLQREGYVEALVHPKVGSAIQAGIFGRIAVTYFEWAGVQHDSIVVGWRVIEDADSAEQFARALASAPFLRERYTSISSAIDFAVPLFDGNGFEGMRRVTDISGDGANNRGRLVTLARDDAVAAGIIINGLPIINDRINPFGIPPLKELDLYYENCVIGGPGSFIVAAEDFGAFASAILRKLILEIAGLASETRPELRHLVASERVIPPCDAGERQLQQFLRFRQQF